jgi:hypothetical protein
VFLLQTLEVFLTIQQVQKKAEELLKFYQPIFRLDGWDVKVIVMNNDDYREHHGEEYFNNTGACNEMVTDIKQSEIHLRFEPQPQTLAENLIHELVHLMVQEQYHFVDAALNLIGSKSTRKFIKAQHDKALEKSVSNIVRALVCCLLLGSKYKE